MSANLQQKAAYQPTSYRYIDKIFIFKKEILHCEKKVFIIFLSFFNPILIYIGG